MPEARLDRDAAADRAVRHLALAADPDQGGRIYAGSLQEAHVILAMIEAGELLEPVKRCAGRGDCTDAAGQDWDVKSPRDNMPHQLFDVGRFVEKHIRYEVQLCKENVIVDLSRLDPRHRQGLREAVDGTDLAVHVRWYE